MKILNPVRDKSDKTKMLFSSITKATPMGRQSVALMQHGLWGLMIVVLFASVTTAQQPAPSQIDAPLLDVSHGLRAYHLVENLLAERPNLPAKSDPIRVTGLLGVKLTLRSQGITVGHGEAYREDLGLGLDQPIEAIDLVPLIRRATEQAKAEVLESLADARLRAILEGRTMPDPVELAVADVYTRIIVDLELAYDLERIKVAKDAAPDTVFARFAPGYHGLTLINEATGARAWIWPGEVISRNISPPSQLTLGLKQIGIDRSNVTTLARPDGIDLARFNTILLVRPAPERQPTRIIRSGVDAPRYTMDEHQLSTMSDLLIGHLFQRFTSDNRLRGTYHPTSGRYDPSIAADDQAALTCYAVMHHARYLSDTRALDETPRQYAQRALDAATLLAQNTLNLKEEADLRVLSLTLLTMLEAPPGMADDQLRERVGRRLMQEVTHRKHAAGKPSELDSGSTALAAAALAGWYARTRQPEIGRLASSLIDAFWSDPQKVPNISALPWLLLAHAWVGDLVVVDEVVESRPEEVNRRRSAIARLIDQICQYQVIETPAFGPDDVKGGFVLSPGPAGSPPNPDWHNAQPLMLLSTALRDDAITAGQDKMGWLIAVSFSARFIEQLMMDDASCYYVRDSVSALGGVRMAPWDNRLALAPSAMSLLAITELQTTLAEMRGKSTTQDESDAPTGTQEQKLDTADMQE